MIRAPSSASPALPAKLTSITVGAMPIDSWATACAGSTAARWSHHVDLGVSRSAASRIALGGQNTEICVDGNGSERPTSDPRK